MALFFNNARSFGVDPETQGAIDQYAALPAPVMEQRKGGGFGDVLRALAGGVLDGVATHYGAQPGYGPARERQRELMDRLALQQQKAIAEEQARQRDRMEGREDKQWEWANKPEAQSEDSFTRAMAAAGYQPGTPEYTALAKKRAEMLTNPVQLVPDGMGGMTPTRPYGGDAPDVLDPETVRRMTGGGVSNGTGGF